MNLLRDEHVPTPLGRLRVQVGGEGPTMLLWPSLLMTGDLARVTNARFLVGSIGGILLPMVCVLLSHSGETSAQLTFAIVGLLGLNLIGELLERYLFFAAVVAPKMPGAPTA